MHWSNKDFSNHFHAALPPDKQFFDTFQFFTPISKAYYQEGLQLLKRRAKDQNVQYLETMLAHAPGSGIGAAAARLDALSTQSGLDEITARLAQEFSLLEMDVAIQKEINEFVREIDSVTAGLDDSDFMLRTQAYITRNDSPSAVFANMYSAFIAAGKTNKIVGVNIVGPENGVVAMRDYSLHMHMFRFLKMKYPQVSLSLHAGELALGMVPPEGLRHHIRDAIEVAGAKRIGHGIDIMYESDASQLLKKMAKERIAVEINLTSNEFIAGVAGMNHPVTLYMQQNVPIVISTDDEGVSRSTMSNEYLLFVSRYKPSYAVLKKTIFNSLEFSFLDQAEKVKQKKILEQRFMEFERTIADELKRNAALKKH